MADGVVHTVYKDGRWVNEIEGVGQVGAPHATKDRAAGEGRARALRDKTEHVIHDRPAGEHAASSGVGTWLAAGIASALRL